MQGIHEMNNILFTWPGVLNKARLDAVNRDRAGRLQKVDEEILIFIKSDKINITTTGKRTGETTEAEMGSGACSMWELRGRYSGFKMIEQWMLLHAAQLPSVHYSVVCMELGERAQVLESVNHHKTSHLHEQSSTFFQIVPHTKL
jgi:hypothetical protein